MVRQLQMLLHRHGLGQALACLQLRGGGKPASPYLLLVRQLDRWLLTQRLVDRLGIEIRVARDPPSTSKYNPIQHRLFPHLITARALTPPWTEYPRGHRTRPRPARIKSPGPRRSPTSGGWTRGGRS
ncbi:MAG: hypothetical protein JO034_25015 [Singulisphaera sp.]|nr:hypothetical protein [Singulisphaera sp.]